MAATLLAALPIARRVLSHAPLGSDAHTATVSPKFQLSLIDYEYAVYNFRGFDLGNHFCERYIDNAAAEYPGFSIELALFPSDLAIATFARQYLNALHTAQRVCTRDVCCS